MHFMREYTESYLYRRKLLEYKHELLCPFKPMKIDICHMQIDYLVKKILIQELKFGIQGMHIYPKSIVFQIRLVYKRTFKFDRKTYLSNFGNFF